MFAKIKKCIHSLFYIIKAPFWYLFFISKGISFQWGWHIAGLPIIRKTPGSTLKIGKRFWAISSPKINIIGTIQPVIINSLGMKSVLILGDDVGISGCTITAANRIEIGNRVLVGSGVLIMDTDAHPESPINRRYNLNDIRTAPIIIEDDVYIGARAIILKGVRIGKGSIIGAGSVVTKDIPAMSIACGNPAAIVRQVVKK